MVQGTGHRAQGTGYMVQSTGYEPILKTASRLSSWSEIFTILNVKKFDFKDCKRIIPEK
jgi:hypothetical protein